MAQIIWSEPALQDMDAIADYIALDNPHAARGLGLSPDCRTAVPNPLPAA